MRGGPSGPPRIHRFVPEGEMKNRYLAALLLAIPFMVAMAPAFADSTRTLDAALSHVKAWFVVTMSK
jgi:hypothetical protein